MAWQINQIALILFILVTLGLIFAILWSNRTQATSQAPTVYSVSPVSQAPVSQVSQISSASVSQPVHSGAARQDVMSPADIATYIYCYPIVLMNITREYDFAKRENKAFNVLLHQRETPDSKFESISVPNDNLLYSTAWVKLPFTITIPAVKNRYILLSLLDWFGNILWRQDSPLETTKEDNYTMTFEKSSFLNAVWFIIRIFCDGSEMDLEKVYQLQDKIVLTSSVQEVFVSKDKGMNNVAPAIQMEQMTPKEYYTLAQDTLQLIEDLPAKGISNALATILAKPDDEIFTDPTLLCCPDKVFAMQSTQTNGWTFSQHIGDFGDDYMLRAFIAKWLFAGNREEDTHYFFQFNLDPAQSYQMILDFFPLVKPLGFWSFTLYNQETGLLLHDVHLTLNSINSSRIPVDQKSAIIVLRKNPNPLVNGKVLGIFRVYAPTEPMVRQGKFSWFPPILSPIRTEYEKDKERTLVLQM